MPFIGRLARRELHRALPSAVGHGRATASVVQDPGQILVTGRVLADVVADPGVSSAPETADPKDEFLVALARVADVVALVSGDPHLTELVDLDPPVITPAAFMDRLRDWRKRERGSPTEPA